MKFLKLMLILVAVIQGLPILGTELAEIKCNYTYQGQIITPENIVSLSPKVPTDLEKHVQDYLKAKPDLIEIFSGLAHYRKLPFYNKAPYAFNFNNLDLPMRGYLESMAMALGRAGIQVPQDQSRYNRVLANVTLFMGSEWVIKSSGFLNRRANILHEMSMDNRDPELPQEKLDQFINSIGLKTYQTISRMPYWLMVKEGIEKFKLDRIALPKMYLVHIPGRPDEATDSNYVIVEENIGGRQLNRAIDFQDAELKRQYDIIQRYADLWDNSEPNYIIKDGKLYPVDTEQPNNQKPSNFFWKDKAKPSK